MNYKKIKDGVEMILIGVYGEDILKDPNFTDTPERVARAYREMLYGEHLPNREMALDSIAKKVFPCDFEQIVCSDWIEVYSMCPHHLLPVAYSVAVAYMPSKPSSFTDSSEAKGYVIGASKLARLSRILGARAILQEQLTEDIARELKKMLNPRGIGVLIKGKHQCMMCRGVRTRSSFKTSYLGGVFRSDEKVRQEFFELIKI